MTISQRLGGTNSLHCDPLVHGTGTEVVPLTTLDVYADINEIDRFDLIKVDVEGHEMAVLEGATNLLRRQAVELVQFEYNWRWIAARRYLRDAFELLGDQGYELARVTAAGFLPLGAWEPALENFWEANFLAYSDASRTFVHERFVESAS